MGDFWNCRAGLQAGALLWAGVRYHSLLSITATAVCDKEAAHKWSREGKHLLQTSRYTDHLQIAQLVPDFPLLCLATCNAATREAAVRGRDGSVAQS